MVNGKSTNPQSGKSERLSDRLLGFVQQQWGGLVVIIGLILFPYIFSLLSGLPVDRGAPKFWQGQMIVIFIMAVYAMSYDLLLGYTGVLSFGHAAFFGGGAYAMAQRG